MRLDLSNPEGDTRVRNRLPEEMKPTPNRDELVEYLAKLQDFLGSKCLMFMDADELGVIRRRLLVREIRSFDYGALR